MSIIQAILAGDLDSVLDDIVTTVAERKTILSEQQARVQAVLDKEKERINQRIPNEKLAGEHYGIDDYIKLVVRPGNNADVTCIRYLQKWGAWWKVKAAVNRGEKWLLKSIQEQPREFGKTKVEEMTILKDLDPRYAVVAVLKFPLEFAHKLAELTARTQQE